MAFFAYKFTKQEPKMQVLISISFLLTHHFGNG